MIIDVLPKVINKTITRIKQNNKEASYAPIIKESMNYLILKIKPAREIFNQVRHFLQVHLLTLKLIIKTIR